MEREIKRGMGRRAGGREGGWGCDSGRPLRGSNHARIRLHPLAFVCWRSRSGESPEPDHCHFHLLPIMPFSSPAMRSCTGPWEAKRPSVGREREGQRGDRVEGEEEDRKWDPVMPSEPSVAAAASGRMQIHCWGA